MIQSKRSRKNENSSDVRYYNGYTKFTVPRVRGNQYNPMIVGEREELFNNILDNIDKKQTSPKYDDLFYVEGKNIDASGGVEYQGMLSHSDDDYTKVNILCELRDKKSGKTFESFEKDLFLNYSDFMDSYGIESDIEDHILEELKKYMIGILAQYDNKYKKENKTIRELKRSLESRGIRRLNESEEIIDTVEELNNFLSGLIDDEVDVTADEGASGLHHPDYDYLSMTMKANDNDEAKIACLVPDIEAIDWSGYVDDVLDYIKKWNWHTDEEEGILNAMFERLLDYFWLHTDGDTKEVKTFTLPISKNKIKNIIFKVTDKLEKELENFVKDNFYDEIEKRANRNESKQSRRFEYKLKRNRKVENMRKEFDEFVYNLIELLNNTFNQEGGWFLSDNEFNRLGATIEHENGVKFELYDEEVNNDSDVTLLVIYPNRKSKWLGNLWQKDLTDIADKMYEYAVVRNRNESKIKSLLDSVLHGGLYKENKNIRELKRNRKVESADDKLTLENARDLCKYIEHNCPRVKELGSV